MRKGRKRKELVKKEEKEHRRRVKMREVIEYWKIKEYKGRGRLSDGGQE